MRVEVEIVSTCFYRNLVENKFSRDLFYLSIYYVFVGNSGRVTCFPLSN